MQLTREPVITKSIVADPSKALMWRGHRYCPATDARFTYRGEDLAKTLERICKPGSFSLKCLNC